MGEFLDVSANFLSQMLGLPAPNQWGPFQVVATGNGVSVDFMDKDGNISMQHYAFLVSEAEFDQVLGRVRLAGSPILGRSSALQGRRD